ncbi:hypothetical protein L1887_26889 [Cichorium endivia]|nr:hypothetical protein L1887_26889 [Cichorium endivia]
MEMRWIPLPNKHSKQKNPLEMDMFTFLPSWLLSTVLILLFSSILMYALRGKKTSKGAPNLPPSPPRLPIIGNLHQVIGKNFHQILWRVSRKYGPIMTVHLGSTPYVIISSSEFANQALKTHDQILCNRPRSKGFKRLTFDYMDVAFSPHAEQWKEMRKVLVTEFLGSKRSKLFKKVVDNEVKGMLESFSSQPSNTTVNLDERLFHLVTDIVSRVAVGKSYREEKFRGLTLKEMLDDLVISLCGSVSDIYPNTIGLILDEVLGFNRRLDKCFSNFDAFLQMVLDEHIDHNGTSDHEKDLVDACRSQLTTNEMKALLMNVLNGAIDTTTTTMVWTMSEIVKNPRVMQKLQEEIRRCVGRKSSVEESDVANMTYLKLVVKEALRLHSTVPFLLTRECVKHCQIGGYDIFPGTRVLINAWGIGRDPKVWSESAPIFNPERLENLEVDRSEMIPFGGGRRACPASSVATQIVEYTIANLFYSFDWKLPSGMSNDQLDMEEVGSLIVVRKTPLCLVPVKHNMQD